jgi:hypothetical protein
MPCDDMMTNTKQHEPTDFDREVLWEVANELAESLDGRLDSGSSAPEMSMFAGRFVGVNDFVDEALDDSNTPIAKHIDRWGRAKYNLSRLAKRHLKPFLHYAEVVKALPDDYDFGEQVNLFRACWRSVATRDNEDGLALSQLFLLKFGASEPVSDRYADFFNLFVEELRSLAKMTSYVAAVGERRRSAERRHRRYSRHGDSLFDACPHIIVVRLDLEYSDEFAKSITLQQAKDDIKHFINNRRGNKLFKGLINQMAKLEFGVKRGLHWHVILYFDASVRDPRKHVHLAKTIGEYWKNVITKKRGTYWNVNARIDEFREKGICGIGPIHASDDELRSNLRNFVIGYLCKSDQFIRPKVGKRIRLISRGNKLPPAKGGRPRRGKAGLRTSGQAVGPGFAVGDARQ